MQPGEGLLQVLEARLCEMLAQSDTDFTVSDLMNTMWAFAAMERQPGKLLLQVLEDRVEKCIEQCWPLHVCMLLWSYARMGGQPGAWLQFLIEGKLEEQMSDLSTFHVSRILWAYGAMKILPNGKVLQALELQKEVGDRGNVDRDEVVPDDERGNIKAMRLARSNLIRPMPIPGEHLSETTSSKPPQKLNNPSIPGFRAALPPPPPPPRPSPSLQQDGIDEDGTGGASCVAGRAQEEGMQDHQEQQEHQEQHADGHAIASPSERGGDGHAIASPRDRGDVRQEADDDPWRRFARYSAVGFGRDAGGGSQLERFSTKGRKLFVAGIPFKWDDRDLHECFTRFGIVSSSQVACELRSLWRLWDMAHIRADKPLFLRVGGSRQGWRLCRQVSRLWLRRL